MAGTWLEPEDVFRVLGDELASRLSVPALDECCQATRAYVERSRPDLFVAPDPLVPEVTEFVADAAVRVGAALLAHRFYARRTSPLGVLGLTDTGASGILREDPDIARLLGVGAAGAFVFGSAPWPVEDVVV